MKPISRQRLIRGLRALGFSGPFSGGKHEAMRRGLTKVTIPNLRAGEIGEPLLAEILGQAGIAVEEWAHAFRRKR